MKIFFAVLLCVSLLTFSDLEVLAQGGGADSGASSETTSSGTREETTSPGTRDDTGSGSGLGTSGGSVTIQNPLKANSITELFLDLIEVVLVFATPLIVFFIIYAGFLYVTARGNPEQITQANRALLYAVIGGVLILGAFVILSVIKGTVDAITI